MKFLNDCNLSATRPQRQTDEVPFGCRVKFIDESMIWPADRENSKVLSSKVNGLSTSNTY